MSAPNQNTGMDMPMRASTVTPLSEAFPAFTALNRPSATPATNQMIAAPMARTNVRGAPSLIRSTTFSRFA